MRNSILLSVVLLILFVPFTFAQEKVETWGSDGNGNTVVKTTDDVPKLNPTKLRDDGVSLRSMRKAGVTFFGMRREAKKMKAEGIDVKAMHRPVLAAEILVRIQENNPPAFEAAGQEYITAGEGRDWEKFFAALIAFITKLLPLILMII